MEKSLEKYWKSVRCKVIDLSTLSTIGDAGDGDPEPCQHCGIWLNDDSMTNPLFLYFFFLFLFYIYYLLIKYPYASVAL